MCEYKTMTPCERVRYYRAQIDELDPSGSSREARLLRMFEFLIRENLSQCVEEGAEGNKLTLSACFGIGSRFRPVLRSAGAEKI